MGIDYLLCIPLCVFPALLYEGTVDIALMNLSNLSDYESKKASFLSGVKFSVEQVNIHNNYIFLACY